MAATEQHSGPALDVLDPARPKRVLIVASNPTVSEQTGWPIGFWWGELTHPYWELTERGYVVEMASPDGGALQGDSAAAASRCHGAGGASPPRRPALTSPGGRTLR